MSSHTFTIITLSVYFAENSSSLGAIILQGPHHVAWKSTTTKRSPALSSFASKSALKRKEKEEGLLSDKSSKMMTSSDSCVKFYMNAMTKSLH